MTRALKNENERFLRFVLVGLLNTLVDFGLMNLFTQGLRIQLVLAQAMSFSIAVACSYLLNRIWIYPEAIGGSIKAQFPKFVAINLLGLVVRSLLVPLVDQGITTWLRANPIIIKDLPQSFFSQNAALALVLPITILMNFFLNRTWTFRVGKVSPR